MSFRGGLAMKMNISTNESYYLLQMFREEKITQNMKYQSVKTIITKQAHQAIQLN